MSSRSRLVLIVLFVAIMGLHLWSLMRYPPPFVDEAWFASRAWAFIQTGRVFGPLDAGVFDRFDGYWTMFPWLPTLIQSLGLRFFTAPDLLPVRMVSLIFGLILLGAIYVIADDLGGPRFGLLSVLLVSISRCFFVCAHLARYDVLAAAFGFIAIALYLKSRTSRWWLSLLSGLCVGLAFEIHAHGAIYGPTLVALYFLHLRWSMFWNRRFWGFIVGVSAGLAFYAALHILPYPQTYFELYRLAFGPTHTPPILTLDPYVIVQAFEGMGWLVLAVYLALAPLIIWATLALLQRRSDTDKTLLVLGAVLVLAQTVLVRNQIEYYAILFTPGIDLIVAMFLLDHFRRTWQGHIRDYARHALVGGSVIAYAVLNLYFVLPPDWGSVYQTVQEQIKPAVQPGDSIMAAQTYWFGLHDHVYYSWEELIYYQRYAPGSTLEDALREFRPDIFIIDGHMEVFISDQVGDKLYTQHLRLPRAELETFLSRHARLIVVFDGGYYGQIRVYRINWAEPVQSSLSTNRRSGGTP